MSADQEGRRGKRIERAIVVGASSGIGAAVARRLAAGGTHVALVARRAGALAEVVAEIEAAGGSALARAHDVRDVAEAPAVFEALVQALGGLDLVVYAAGVMPPVEEHEYDFAKDQAMIEVNLLGAMRWFDLAAPQMEAQRAGTLVGVSSIAGERGRRGNPAYCTSKAALSTYLEALRNRLSRYRVDVVTIKPGFVDTRMTEGMGELLWMVSPEEIAERTVALARRPGPHDVFVPRRWGPALFVVRNIPSFIFRRTNV